ncbi:uncharacterized protein LOC116664784 [Camelus ferus]|uniref:Uncharacterized protein LOC116664784 n=1 Tax=Camelus ferus TaxID=419612 RepID=A0A8B8T9V9_CAMFR|nr:uncharacterized protein LOC116664784 [Camelus ferus]
MWESGSKLCCPRPPEDSHTNPIPHGHLPLRSHPSTSPGCQSLNYRSVTGCGAQVPGTGGPHAMNAKRRCVLRGRPQKVALSHRDDLLPTPLILTSEQQPETMRRHRDPLSTRASRCFRNSFKAPSLRPPYSAASPSPSLPWEEQQSQGNQRPREHQGRGSGAGSAPPSQAPSHLWGDCGNSLRASEPDLGAYAALSPRSTQDSLGPEARRPWPREV